MKKGLLFGCVLGLTGFCLLAASAADNPEKAGFEFPPRVIKTEPADRAVDVDPTIEEIKATFDRPMQTKKSWSWILHRSLGAYPGYRGSAEPKWENNGKTCVLAVKLTPGTLYAVGVNSFRHTGFRDKNGKTAVPHVWVFKTKKAQ